MANGNSTQSGLEAIGHEMKVNSPAIVNSTRRKFGANKANKQRVAILLSKGRKAGLNIPQSKGMSSR